MQTATRSREVVVVTGASAGVGRAVAREFGRRRACVGLVARNTEALAAAAHEIEALGGEALACVADVADARALRAAAQAIEDRFGPIDVWVNNAMVTIVSPVAMLDADEVRRVTEVTYLGSVHGTLEALARMRRRNRGTIVQVGSALAYRSIPLQAPYCAAKAAIRAFIDSLRSELMHERSDVRITMVQLPAHNTPQFDWCRTKMPRKPMPVPPVFQPEVAARAIVWAAHHGRREVLLGGSTRLAVLAQKIAPGLADRYLAKYGYSSQQRDERVAPDRRDNLYETLPGDRGAHGSFDAMAHERSAVAWLDRHRGAIAALAAVAVAGALAMQARVRRSSASSGVR